MGRLKEVFLKKVKSSSLSEVLVATVILLVVFGIAVATLNNIMISTVKKDTQKLQVQLEELIYKYKNNQIQLPYSIQEDMVIITIQKRTNEEISFVEFMIEDKENEKKVERQILETYGNQ